MTKTRNLKLTNVKGLEKGGCPMTVMIMMVELENIVKLPLKERGPKSGRLAYHFFA